MLIALALASLIGVGAPWPVVGVLASAVWSPYAGLATLATLVVGCRRRGEAPIDAEAVWCGAMAAELRAGASLRHAIDAASGRVPELGLAAVGRKACAGVPMDRISDEVAAALPRMRVLVGPALRIAAESGGTATGVFGRLAVRSLQEVEAERERKVASAQVRLSALVIAALPVFVLAALVSTGRAAALLEAGPVGVAALGLGIGLQVSGVAAVWMLSRRVGA